MSVLYIVLPLALVIIAVAVLAYRWAAHSGQFDDLTTPAMRALQDDEPRSTDQT
jgi:cbb3-type cytochrome oxidase maturation protein